MFPPRGLTPGGHTLAWLALTLIPAFAATAVVARSYRAEQRELAREWHGRGETALAAHQPERAIEAFRTALTYSREDRVLRLRLAQALMAAGRDPEARAHLLTLWANQPGNGPVNLALARLAAKQGDMTMVLRHYHNAIEGAWDDAPEDRRRLARLELARFLVDQHATPQAQAELIALAADLPSDRPQQTQAAALLAAADLPQLALQAYEGLVATNGRDAGAAAGAGRAAFILGNGPLARRYLTAAVRLGTKDPDIATLLEVVRLEAELDPFARRLSRKDRVARTARVLAAAQARLQCIPPGDPAIDALRSEVAAAALTSTADAADAATTDDAMDIVLRVEEAALSRCAAPSAVDRALTRIAEKRQGAGG